MVISAPPQNTSKNDDDDDDIMATLMKYEAQVKKDTKKAPTAGLVPAQVTTSTVVRKSTQMSEAAKKSSGWFLSFGSSFGACHLIYQGKSEWQGAVV